MAQELMRMGFEGSVWLLLERRGVFSPAKWRQEQAELYSDQLPFSRKPQVLLRFQNELFLVRQARAVDANAEGTDRKKLELQVRRMDDVRRVWEYHTSAKTMLLDFYVDVEFTRERIIAFVRDPMAPQIMASLPVAASPAPAPAPVAVSNSPNTNAILDEAFASLSAAQSAREKDRNELALSLYQDADRKFHSAMKLLPETHRSYELLRCRRQDLHKTIETFKQETAAAKEPSSSHQQANTAQAPVFPEPPSFTSTAGTALSVSGDLSARLQALHTFVAQQKPVEKPPVTSNLQLRLQALRSEPAAAPAADDLADRLRRLRSGAQVPSAAPLCLDAPAPPRPLSAVDEIIQQVQDEIAMGIKDDSIADEEEDASSVSSGSQDESQDSNEEADSDGSSEQPKRQRVSHLER